MRRVLPGPRSKVVCKHRSAQDVLISILLYLVYPQKTKEDIAHSTVENPLNEPSVEAILGTTKIKEKKSDYFYKASDAKTQRGFYSQATPKIDPTKSI